MSLRISHSVMRDSAIHTTQVNLDLLARKQMQIASGQNYIRRSDDTASSARAESLEQEITQNRQYDRNIDIASNWATISDAHMTNVIDIMQRIKELSTEANNGVNPPEVRKNLAIEVDQLLEDLYRISNSTIDGVPIFAGTDTSQDAFLAARDASGQITSIAYQGDDGNRTVKTGEVTTAAYNLRGGGTDGLFVSSNDGVDLFSSLITLRDELASGDIPQDTTFQAIDDSLDHAISKMIKNGLLQKRFNSLGSQNLNIEIENYSLLSSLKDLDIAQAVTELSYLQTSYQASLQIAARINQLSMVNYI
ncbi:MAG: hypothetical protein HRT89_18305 [Lentisphaeria bacterium]|nr:hypothetical protein [Lentisphaeria bacterium]NQZ70011.1 hypothetical protein [Lentisphaeria bacterium]